MSELRITALEPVRRHGDRLHLCIDGERRCTVACDASAGARLAVGERIDARALDRLIRLDAVWQARNAALGLLATRPRARGELVDRLHRKGHGNDAIVVALGELDRMGHIDDAAFSRAWASDRLRLRPRGTRALVAELLRKGVSPETAHAAVAGVMADAQVSDEQLCGAAAAKWLRTHGPIHAGGEDGHRRSRRLREYLARRGYAPATIRAALDALPRHPGRGS